MIVTILALIFVFGLLVFTHELGHFLAAKALGVQVKTFAFGFPPRVWSKKVGDTVYAVNWIPLGGYVSLKGEEELDNEGGETQKKPDSDSLQAKKPWQLIIIFMAGVVMNILLAIVLLYICYLAGFKPIAPDMANYPGISNNQKVSITKVEKGAPAEKQGIMAGDVLVSVNGVKTQTTASVINEIQKAATKGKETVDVVVVSSGRTVERQVTTYKSKSGNTEVTRIGVELSDIGNVQGGIFTSLYAAVVETFKLIGLTFMGIISLFSQIILSFRISDQVTGPVGIVLATNYFASLGFVSLLQFAAILSISLAVFNILPIPALDGGHILFSVIEFASRRKISQRVKNVTAMAGFALLITLMIAVTVKDLFTFDIIGLVKGMFAK